MKSFSRLFLSSLLLASSAMALTAKVESPKLAKGTSIGKYAKPGAPVDIRYTTEYVEAGEMSQVNITLLTGVSSGTMDVEVHLDKKLHTQREVTKSLHIALNSKNNEYPLSSMQVFADEDGIYYVKFIVNLKGKGFRAFAVPIYVGHEEDKKKKKSQQKTKSGKNISIMPAKESIY